MLNRFLDKFVYANQLKFEQYNFYLGEIPFVMLPVEILSAMAATGDEKLDRATYYGVKRAVANKLVPQFRTMGLSQEKFLRFAETFFAATGFGFMQNIQVDFEKKRAIVTVAHSPVAKSLAGKSAQPVDHMLRGILAGVFCAAFKQEMECLERKCHAVHANGSCEFVILEPQNVDFSEEHAKRQVALSP